MTPIEQITQALDRAKEREEKATCGPWTGYGDVCLAKNGSLVVEVLRGSQREHPIQSNRNFIASSRTEFPAFREALRCAVEQIVAITDLVVEPTLKEKALNRIAVMLEGGE